MRILILGGTRYIGPHFVRAAVERGHHVAVFNRGNNPMDWPPEVERLVGDRNSDLESIKNRDWDAAFDLAVYVPKCVRSLGQALKDRVNHYTFISSVAVYARPKANERMHEHSPVLAYAGDDDPYSLATYRDIHEYGAFKLMCEREAETQFPGRTLVLRPGYIVGPGDPNGALAYWPVRLAKGGEALVAGDPSVPVQFVDVRDLAEGAIRLAENRTTGVYNTAGPAVSTGLGQLVEIASSLAPASSKATWVPAHWLAAQSDRFMWSRVLFWSFEAEGWAWSMQMSIERALARGITFRPIRTTLVDTVEWYRTLPEEVQATPLSTPRREAAFHRYRSQKEAGTVDVETIRWPAYLAREREALASWHRQQAKGA